MQLNWRYSLVHIVAKVVYKRSNSTANNKKDTIEWRSFVLYDMMKKKTDREKSYIIRALDTLNRTWWTRFNQNNRFEE